MNRLRDAKVCPDASVAMRRVVYLAIFFCTLITTGWGGTIYDDEHRAVESKISRWSWQEYPKNEEFPPELPADLQALLDKLDPKGKYVTSQSNLVANIAYENDHSRCGWSRIYFPERDTFKDWRKYVAMDFENGAAEIGGVCLRHQMTKKEAQVFMGPPSSEPATNVFAYCATVSNQMITLTLDFGTTGTVVRAFVNDHQIDPTTHTWARFAVTNALPDGSFGVGLSALTPEERKIISRQGWLDQLQGAAIFLRHRLTKKEVVEILWQWRMGSIFRPPPIETPDLSLFQVEGFNEHLSSIKSTNKLVYSAWTQGVHDLRFCFDKYDRIVAADWVCFGGIVQPDGTIASFNSRERCQRDTKKHLFYVDCFDDKLVLYPGEITVKREELQKDAEQLKANTSLKKFIDEVEANNIEPYFVFLVRPDAAEMHRLLIREEGFWFPGIHHWYEPIRAEAACKWDSRSNQLLLDSKDVAKVADLDQTLLPLPHWQNWKRKPVYFECRGNELFYEDSKDLKFFLHRGGAYWPVEMTEQDFENYRKVVRGIVTSKTKPGNKGETPDELLKPGNWFQTVLEEFDCQKHFLVFLVHPDSFPVLQAARREARRLGFENVWYSKSE